MASVCPHVRLQPSEDTNSTFALAAGDWQGAHDADEAVHGYWDRVYLLVSGCLSECLADQQEPHPSFSAATLQIPP